MIYFIQAENDGPIKIGASRQLSIRIKEHRKTSGASLRLLAVLDGYFKEEKELHQRFRHLRIAREWFRPETDLLSFIANEGKEWDGTEEGPFTKYTYPVKLDPKAVTKAKIAAAYKGMHLAEYISDVIARVAIQDAREGHAKQEQEVRSEPDGKAEPPKKSKGIPR